MQRGRLRRRRGSRSGGLWGSSVMAWGPEAAGELENFPGCSSDVHTRRSMPQRACCWCRELCGAAVLVAIALGLRCSSEQHIQPLTMAKQKIFVNHASKAHPPVGDQKAAVTLVQLHAFHREELAASSRTEAQRCAMASFVPNGHAHAPSTCRSGGPSAGCRISCAVVPGCLRGPNRGGF
jgi:hypothetical protein